jgi:hypothetical protein
MTAKRRGRRPMKRSERKDRLVQTRVPGDLDEALREEAKKKRVSVSQLIRNVLEDTFELVDNVVGSATRLGQTVKRDAQRIAESAKGHPHASALETIYAWQEVLLNRDAGCARCKSTLQKGDTAMVGLNSDSTAPTLWLCLRCSRQVG